MNTRPPFAFTWKECVTKPQTRQKGIRWLGLWSLICSLSLAQITSLPLEPVEAGSFTGGGTALYDLDGDTNLDAIYATVERPGAFTYRVSWNIEVTTTQQDIGSGPTDSFGLAHDGTGHGMR